MPVVAVLADGQRAVPRRRFWSLICLCADQDRICHRSLRHGGEATARRARPAARRQRISRRLRLHDRRHGDLAVVWRAGQGSGLRRGRIPFRAGLQARAALDRPDRQAPGREARPHGQPHLRRSRKPAPRAPRRRRFRHPDAGQDRRSGQGVIRGEGDTAMGFFEKGNVRIHYEEAGSGFPLLLIAGGGLNSNISRITGDYPPFNAMKEFGNEYRCIAFDLRNAPPGQSSGPLEIERPWDSHTDDQLALMDHLGFDRFMVLGFCIGGPLIWNLIKRAPDRVVAAVLAMPSGSRPEMRDLFYDNNMKGWAPQLVERRPDITMEMAEKFLTRMYRTDPDFVFTVTRDFVRQCQTPVLILPDDIPAHPYAAAMES